MNTNNNDDRNHKIPFLPGLYARHFKYNKIIIKIPHFVPKLFNYIKQLPENQIKNKLGKINFYHTLNVCVYRHQSVIQAQDSRQQEMLIISR